MEDREPAVREFVNAHVRLDEVAAVALLGDLQHTALVTDRVELDQALRDVRALGAPSSAVVLIHLHPTASPSGRKIEHGAAGPSAMGCSGAHPTGAEVLTATVTNTGPTAMSNRTALLALAAAALMMIGSTASAGAREVVRYTAEVQPGTIVVKTAERKLYLVLGGGEAIRYTVAVGRPGKQWQGQARG